VDDIRTDRERRHALIINDPLPVDSVNSMWVSAGHGAIIGIFLLLFGTFIYVGRAILLPILAAAVLALTLAPLIKAAKHWHSDLDHCNPNSAGRVWSAESRRHGAG